ncbi:UDP-N-acetylglucosamine 2-epimerase [Bremerella sp. P1]|uniref:UDP-N-acetylglucosamine 2-epimerase n=1 Tax=Bremerella sp. P1 TaxID=3026424 RepID=UPI002367E3EB|nr:UDP-N-acetylglucosamine 2-epimerase [Bremerella sp. P1]WDI43865.1 UDP-N-acetylglucosamine 2-epimerase [Bremerella sp. P1]
MVKRRVCVVTGSRADYGLLVGLLTRLQNDNDLDLQLVATGMHLSPEFGMTCQQIEEDGFQIDSKVEMLVSSDSDIGVAKSMGLGVISASDALQSLSPDIVLVLGDRFEIFSFVLAAYYLRTPVAHIHGGEVTTGSLDDGVRHAITKLSTVHFVAAEPYRQRVIQLGESPSRVMCVGGLGVDNIVETQLLTRRELEAQLAFSLGAKSILVTYHPQTSKSTEVELDADALLAALSNLDDTVRIVFSRSNADTGGRKISQRIDQFVEQNASRAAVFTSLGQVRYWSLMREVDAVVGNSSSGILEAPTFHTPTVNIGDRQNGRVRCASIIDCPADSTEILASIHKALTPDFRSVCERVENPLGVGGASDKIVKALKNLTDEDLKTDKTFFDCYEHAKHCADSS